MMPGYKTHDTVAYIAAPIITFAATLIVPIPYALGLGAAFLIANHWLSPDLDIESIMIRRWGALYVIWYPYQRLIHHRSVLSHSGPLSAALRIIYLSAWIILPILLFMPLQTIISHILQYWIFYAILYAAAALADTLHTTLDYIT